MGYFEQITKKVVLNHGNLEFTIERQLVMPILYVDNVGHITQAADASITLLRQLERE